MTIDRSKFQFTSEMVSRGYDEYLVPHLFGPWAEALVAGMKAGSGIRALDVACGPGTVARVLARVIGSRGQVAAIDASPSMIAQAQAKNEVSGAPIAYTVGPAVPLPYPDESFSVATCQQGLQFFPDAHAALAEMRRVLVDGGRLALSVWLPLSECAVFNAFGDALRAADCGELADLLTIPFPHWTGSELADRARRAGFSSVDVEPETRELVFPGGPAQAIQALAGTPIGPLLAALDPAQQAAVTAKAEEASANLVTADGAVRGPMRAWILRARA